MISSWLANKKIPFNEKLELHTPGEVNQEGLESNQFLGAVCCQVGNKHICSSILEPCSLPKTDIIHICGGCWIEKLMAIGLFFQRCVLRIWGNYCMFYAYNWICIYIYIQKYSMLKLWLVSYIFPILGGNNCAVVAKGWVCWNSKSTRCAGSRMPGQLKWVFVKRQVPRLERIFLLKILDSETRGGESDPYSVSCFGKFERVATALEVLGYGSGFDVLV